MTKTVPFAEFEENMRALIDDVIQRGDEVLLTKDGRTVARVVPERSPLAGSVIYEDDIVSPVDAEWDAMNGRR